MKQKMEEKNRRASRGPTSPAATLSRPTPPLPLFQPPSSAVASVVPTPLAQPVFSSTAMSLWMAALMGALPAQAGGLPQVEDGGQLAVQWLQRLVVQTLQQTAAALSNSATAVAPHPLPSLSVSSPSSLAVPPAITASPATVLPASHPPSPNQLPSDSAVGHKQLEISESQATAPVTSSPPPAQREEFSAPLQATESLVEEHVESSDEGADDEDEGSRRAEMEEKYPVSPPPSPLPPTIAPVPLPQEQVEEVKVEAAVGASPARSHRSLSSLSSELSSTDSEYELSPLVSSSRPFQLHPTSPSASTRSSASSQSGSAKQVGSGSSLLWDIPRISGGVGGETGRSEEEGEVSDEEEAILLKYAHGDGQKKDQRKGRHRRRHRR